MNLAARVVATFHSTSRNLLTSFHSLISYRSMLPSQCLLCACTLKNELLCAGCMCDLPFLHDHNLCQQCGLSLTSSDSFCGHCLHKPPAFSRSHIPMAYEYPLTPLIHKFKYRRHLTSGKLLGQLFADYIQNCAQNNIDWQMPDMIIPTPLHWTRRWQRGFNQAEILGNYVATELNLPLVTNIIQRKQCSSSQKELTRAERQKNLRKAFTISEKNRTKIIGKRIALIDDVVTTTATVRELSQLLMKAGAADVQIWALARTM